MTCQTRRSNVLKLLKILLPIWDLRDRNLMTKRTSHCSNNCISIVIRLFHRSYNRSLYRSPRSTIIGSNCSKVNCFALNFTICSFILSIKGFFFTSYSPTLLKFNLLLTSFKVSMYYSIMEHAIARNPILGLEAFLKLFLDVVRINPKF